MRNEWATPVALALVSLLGLARLVGAGPSPVAMDGPKIEIVADGTWKDEVEGIKRPSPGNTKKFKATITPAEFKGKIKFVLATRSSEKGTNMNTGDDTGPDLVFEAQDDFDAPNKDKSAIVTKEPVNAATVVLTSKDYGPYGTIRAEIVGLKAEEPVAKSAEIAVLADTDKNNIEDAWDAKYKSAKASEMKADFDADPAPKEVRTLGDWLSRYEEYRGFMLNGAYVSTNPLVLDYFYLDIDGIGELDDMTSAIHNGAGMHLLKRSECKEEEWTLGGTKYTRYLINSNQGFAKVHPQAAVPITNSTREFSGWGYTEHQRGQPIPYFTSFCRVAVVRFGRYVSMTEDIDEKQKYIETTKPKPVDDDLGWEPDGKVTVDGETVRYQRFQSSGGVRNLVFAAKKGHTVLLVQPFKTVPDDDIFGVIGSEYITMRFANLFFPSKMGRTTLAADVAKADTKIKVRSLDDFRFSNREMYLVVGDEAMRMRGYDNDTKEITVDRAQLDSTAPEKHEAGTTVLLPMALIGVSRGQLDSEAKDYPVDTNVKIPIGFVGVTRAAGAKAHSKSDIQAFFNDKQRKKAIASTFCHEACHAMAFRHTGRTSEFIMRDIGQWGAFDGHGIYHVHKPAQNFAEMRVKK